MNERPYLALTEVDAVEVIAALDLVAKLHAILGDAVMANHYRTLHINLTRAAHAPKTNARETP